MMLVQKLLIQACERLATISHGTPLIGLPSYFASGRDLATAAGEIPAAPHDCAHHLVDVPQTSPKISSSFA
jgi:hypothetical protein